MLLAKTEVLELLIFITRLSTNFSYDLYEEYSSSEHGY